MAPTDGIDAILATAASVPNARGDLIGHNVSPNQSHDPSRRRFIASWFEALAIQVSVCFHDGSEASTEEVHMKIHSTNDQKSTLCAAAAAGNRALLG